MAETGLVMRSPNFKSVQITTPTAGYTQGHLVASGSLVGVIAETKTVGETAVLIYQCDRIVVAKRAGTGLTIAVGAKVYYRSAGPDVTGASTSNTLCGRCTLAALAADTTVEIDLTGNVVA